MNPTRADEAAMLVAKAVNLSTSEGSALEAAVAVGGARERLPTGHEADELLRDVCEQDDLARKRDLLEQALGVLKREAADSAEVGA